MRKVNPSANFEYICRSDRELPADQQTVFVLSHLSAEQEALLDDNIGYQGENGYILTIGKSNLLALHLGLKEVKNLADDNGNEDLVLKRDESKNGNTLPGVGRPWRMDLINQIPKEARDELATVIKGNAKLDEDEAKNS